MAQDTHTQEAGDRPPIGVAVIADVIKRLPNGPGVYRMIDADGKALYVGKARSLKKRVQSYTRLAGQPSRIARAVMATASMEFVSTRTEIEALLLEANLIKRLRPRFNVLLRDDKSFPYILVTEGHPAPAIVKHRGARSRKGTYFGPFASAGAVGRTINALQRAFLLRTCSDSFYDGRTRPCLLYQIKRCAAPCTGVVSESEYGELVKEATAFLSGRSQAVRTEIQASMQAAAERLDYEAAAVYRDRLTALSHVQSHQGINPHTFQEADVFACHQQGGATCIQVFFFRTGQNWGNRAYFPRADRDLDCSAVLGAFLAQFYDDKPVPKRVLLSHDVEERSLLAAALSEKGGARIEVIVPQRGEKRDLIDHALANAREALGRQQAESASQRTLLADLAERLDLENPPNRIEVYDNSHIMGTNPVGAMIVAGADGLEKSQYRKFNIRSKDLAPGDDYAMMREVLNRRFSRLLKETGPRADFEESDDRVGPWPDLIIVDGGRGQLAAAVGVLAELEIADVPVIGVAKGPQRDAGKETFFAPGRVPFTLQPRDPVLYFVQRLRDEAHRFAIGSHRTRRKNDMARNPLDEIAGVGPSRKRALLRHFGTAKAVSRASVDDLLAVQGISEQTAKAIYDHFHEGTG
ncbi:MAG: excinuclease ABC subunit UvrC [Hyphomicrobiales bacterium]|nr:excinuclease ABC subunit UvrC [Hyphomicrobiales bacterium]